MNTAEFLQEVVTSSQPGYFCLALSSGSRWLEEWYRWPDDLGKIIDKALKSADAANCYFSSYVFRAPQSTKENVLPSRTIQADLDDADITLLPLAPSVLVETSPGRHQGYWILDTLAASLEEHESLSRKLTYSIALCDRSGWPLGRKVRLPNTINHKYLSGPKEVKVVRVTGKRYTPEDFEALPDVAPFLLEHYDPEFLEQPTEVDTHPLELLERIKNNIPVKVYVAYNIQQPDRSEALWGLLCWAFKAGLSRHEVFTLAKGSANNKFADLHHRADQDLAKDVLRAEHAVNSSVSDERQVVQDLRLKRMRVLERDQQVFNVVLDAMKRQGMFLHGRSGAGWYVRADTGRPIAVTLLSERLHALLDLQFGLNPTEDVTHYVVGGLRTYVTNLPDTAVQASLSHYDPDEKHLLLHTGRKTVLRITADGIETVIDGAFDVVFPWLSHVEPFTPSDQGLDWGEELFGNGTRGFGTSVLNVTNMTPAQAMALLKTWLLFLLFRNAASSRPIIATFGQPGGGKSFLFKKVYAFLYGRYKSIGAVTKVEDFDLAVSLDPLVVLDNVDTWERWLPDRLALSAGTSDVTKRKLYTDVDAVVMRRQALLGVTAHNPQFGREDVADRLLLFAYRRLEKFVAEELIRSDVLQKRSAIWGAVVKDAQRVMQTPLPAEGVPQFRIEDFARFGLWIARAIGVESDFRSAVEDVKSSQQTFTLEEEGLLVSAVVKYAQRNNGEAKFRTAAQLWSLLEATCDDARSFQRLYRNSVTLSKKLSVMQASLDKVVHVEQSINDAGARVWLITSKDAHTDDATVQEGGDGLLHRR